MITHSCGSTIITTYRAPLAHSLADGKHAVETSTCSTGASKGGGIDNVGTVEINNSTLASNLTFLHNTYKREGGGIVSSGILWSTTAL